MKVLLAAAVVLFAATPARADVTITVDPSAPFSERELADAVRLRWLEQPKGDVTIRVGTLGAEQLIVVVGDRSETVALPDRDRAASARVVAVVVTSLVAGGGPPGQAAPAAAVVGTSSPEVRRASEWSAILGVSTQLEDLPELSPSSPIANIIRAGFARRMSPSTRAIATVGTGTLVVDSQDVARVVPVRFGVEATHRYLGLELGAQATWFLWDDAFRPFDHYAMCQPKTGRVYSVYAAAKAFVPVVASARMVLDVGAHAAFRRTDILDYRCGVSGVGSHIGAWATASLEWAL
jgi:hypothetical protein